MSLRQTSLRAAIALFSIITISAVTFAASWTSVFQFLPFISAESSTMESVDEKQNSASPDSLAVLISPTGAGGFEDGVDFPVNGWTVVNGASNVWGTMNAAVPCSAGTNCASTGSTFVPWVGQATANVNHFYRDVTFPGGEDAIALSFKYRVSATDISFDFLRVFLVPTSTTPVAGTQLTSGQIGATYERDTLAYGTVNITVPPSAAGTTQRLVFQWRTDGVSPHAAVVVDEISLVTQTATPLTGIRTIPGTYPTVSAAITDLNLNGVGPGGVTFNLADGTTFAEDLPCITAEGTAANQIIFKKAGGGANAIINPTGGSGLVDAGVCIQGGDYITFDGVDVTASGSLVEYGYRVVSINGANGASNNTIKNSLITMNRTNTASRGVMQSTSPTTGGGAVPSSAAGANSGNKYLNLAIQNVYAGIYLFGAAAFPDIASEIGILPGGSTTIGALASNDIGNGTVQAWGIRAANQRDVKISQTEVRNVSSTTTTDGILVETFDGTAGEVSKNKVHDIRNTSTTSTTSVSGIRATHFTSGTLSLRIANNFVYAITSGYTGTVSATRTIKGIFISGTGGATTQSYNIDFNSVLIDGSGSLNISSACFEIATTSGPVMNVRNNSFANVTAAQAGVARHTTWRTTSSATTGNTGSVSNYNNLYIANQINGPVGITNATDQVFLSNWQTATSQDANSISADPLFTSATDLHIPGTSPNQGAGTSIAAVTDDIDGDARPGTPDIGADEVAPPSGPGTVQFSSATYGGNEGTTATITVNRVGGVTGAISVNYATSDGTGTAGTCGSGGDYVSASGTLNWADNDSAAKTFTVTLCSDATSPEPVETASLTLSNPVGTTITGTNPATLNITDVPPGTLQFTATAYQTSEGQTATMSVTRTAGTSGAVGVSYATSDGTATGGASCTPGVDYISTSGTLSWTDGDGATKTFNVQVCNDLLIKGSETIALTLSSPTGGATIGANNPATLSILDTASQFCSTDGPITIPPTTGTPPFPSSPYPSNVVVSGLTGVTSTVRVTLNSLSHTFPDDLDILLVSPTGQKYILMSDTGAGTDAVNATVTFSDAAAAQNGDAVALVSGTFKPSNYEAANDVFATGAPAGPYGDPGPGGTPAGTATLNGTFAGADPNGTWQLFVSDDANNDGGSIQSWCIQIGTVSPGILSFTAPFTLSEGAGTAQIAVERTGGTDGAVSVNYQSSGSTATSGASCGAGVDFVAAAGTLNWANGEGGVKNIPVQICDDASVEPSEDFFLNMAAPTGGVIIGKPNPATYTITDNDAQPGSLQFSSATYSAGESAGNVLMSVTRTVGSNGAVSAQVTFANVSATGGATCAAGVDYINTAILVNFADGDSTPKAVNVPICGEALDEADETFTATLGTPTGGAVIGTPSTATNTIVDDDDPPPTVQLSSSTFTDDETQTMFVGVTRTGNTTGTSSVTLATAGVTATGGASCSPGVDYITVSTSVPFAGGQTNAFVPVQLCGDANLDQGETFTITLSAPSGATIGTPSSATVTINDTASMFSNTTPIAVNGPTVIPYPSTINVSGGPAVIGRIRVTLYDVTYPVPDDLDVLLVGPGGQKFILMADAGGAAPLASPTTLTFYDQANLLLPDSTPLTSGSYEPTSWELGQLSFPAPAPIAPYIEPGNILNGPFSLGTVFGGTSADGAWSLYVRDDNPAALPANEFGIATGILGGWGIELLIPTAANSTVSGRIADASGAGLSNVIVTIQGGPLAEPISTRSNTFGNYSFEGLPTGHVYIVTASSRRFIFSNPTRVVTVNDNVTGLDFTAATTQ